MRRELAEHRVSSRYKEKHCEMLRKEIEIVKDKVRGWRRIVD